MGYAGTIYNELTKVETDEEGKIWVIFNYTESIIEDFQASATNKVFWEVIDEDEWVILLIEAGGT